jgi:hypothetical protein
MFHSYCYFMCLLEAESLDKANLNFHWFVHKLPPPPRISHGLELEHWIPIPILKNFLQICYIYKLTSTIALKHQTLCLHSKSTIIHSLLNINTMYSMTCRVMRCCRLAHCCSSHVALYSDKKGNKKIKIIEC